MLLAEQTDFYSHPLFVGAVCTLIGAIAAAIVTRVTARREREHSESQIIAQLGARVLPWFTDPPVPGPDGVIPEDNSIPARQNRTAQQVDDLAAMVFDTHAKVVEVGNALVTHMDEEERTTAERAGREQKRDEQIAKTVKELTDKFDETLKVVAAGNPEIPVGTFDK